MWAWKSRIGFAIREALPDASALVRRDVKRVARFHAERGVPMIEVRDDAVHSIFAEAVRVADRIALHFLRRGLASPSLGPAKEHPLVAGEATENRSWLPVERGVIGIQCHRQATE